MALALPISFTSKYGWAKSAESVSKMKPHLRFAIASDSHFGQNNTPYEMYFSNLVKWINHEKEEKGLDFLILNGDIIHDDPEYLPEVKMHLKKLNVPVYPVQGNHDMVSHQEWEKIWDFPVNESFTRKGYAFIIMTTSNETGDYLCADQEWLSNQIQSFSDAESIFIFLHISHGGWTKHGTHCPEIMDLIASASNVKAVFHGHDHHEDDVKYFKEKPFFWCGHTGGNWGQEYKGYRIVEVFAKEFETYMVNPLGKRKINHQKSWKQQTDNN